MQPIRRGGVAEAQFLQRLCRASSIEPGEGTGAPRVGGEAGKAAIGYGDHGLRLPRWGHGDAEAAGLGW